MKITVGVPSQPGSSGSVSTQTQDYLARIMAAGGNIDGASLQAIDKFIVRGRSDGWFNAIKQCWVPVGDFNASKVFLITPTGIVPTFNNFASTDYAQEFGYKLTSNTNKFIDTGFIPNSNAVISTDISLGICTLTDDIGSASSYIVGCTPPTGTARPNPFISPRDNVFGNNASGSTMMQMNFGGEGHIALAHYGASVFGSVQNGVACISGTQTVSTSFDSAITIFRTLRETNTMYYSAGAIGFYFIGTDLSNSLLVSISNAIEQLMTDLGRDAFKKLPIDSFGDSITAGSGTTDGSSSRNRWSKKFAKAVGLRDRNVAQGASQIGATSGIYLAGNTRYTGLVNNKSGIVAYVYGTNDISADAAINGTSANISSFQSNTNTVVASLLSNNKKVIVGCPPYRSDTSSHSLTKQIAYTSAAAAAAKANGVPFCDLYNAFLDTGSPLSYLFDIVHPNDAGHNLIAQYMYEAYLGRLIRKPTLDFPSIAAATSADLTVTVYNAVPGMSVSIGLPATLEAGLVANAFVSANDTVTVRLTNITGSAIDPAIGQYKITVFTNY